ncbi:MAG: hypothetical protein EZS28_041555 [Streblomastix strix]|uniref:Uncharacterized protein n=1 Tax=Streblomastix strix TaxID=222440 RepID=A0A5J4TXU1_9EUKA|nr:MAG: hypothetical protein EZS28_041555 [Streblomastix strix]
MGAKDMPMQYIKHTILLKLLSTHQHSNAFFMVNTLTYIGEQIYSKETKRASHLLQLLNVLAQRIIWSNEEKYSSTSFFSQYLLGI